MSDFGDTSGVSGNAGYEYQKLLAAYYLIVKEVREIEYEADGEDISLINEDRNRSSIEYIQAKEIGCGSFTLSAYRTEVFPQMWNAFTEAMDKHTDKSIYCTLITNISYSADLKQFMEICENLRTRGYSLNAFEKCNVVKRNFDAILKHVQDRDLLYRFLWGSRVTPSYTRDYIELQIISHLKNCNVREPRNKLILVKSYISDKGQGVITRNDILRIIGSDLVECKETYIRTYNQDEVKRALGVLDTTKSKYSLVGEYPDIDGIYRDMTFPVERAADSLLSYLDASDNTVTSSAYTVKEMRETVIADKDKVKEEAQTCAELEGQLWAHRKRYEQKINSLMKTARDFGINV